MEANLASKNAGAEIVHGIDGELNRTLQNNDMTLTELAIVHTRIAMQGIEARVNCTVAGMAK